MDQEDAVRAAVRVFLLDDHEVVRRGLRELLRLRQGPPAADPRMAALSDRERAVLALIADGLSNREIGARLYLAEKTVEEPRVPAAGQLQMQRTQVAVFGATLRDQAGLHPPHPES